MVRSKALVSWLFCLMTRFDHAQGDLAGLLQTQPELSTLLDLVTLAGLNDTLSTMSNITIMAPTNAAFEALLQMDIPESAAIRNRNVTSVGALLRNHVWRGLYPTEVVTNIPTFVQTFVTPDESNDVQPFTSINGGQYNGIVRNGDGITLISGELALSEVVMADIPLGDGMIVHVIDAALMFGPPLELYLARAGNTAFNGALTTLQSSGNVNFSLGIDGANSESAPLQDITIFVPIDEAFENVASVLESLDLESALTYHFLNGSIVFSPSLGNVSVPSLQGTDLTFSVVQDGSIFVNDAKIIFPNVILSNGVAHIIDSVLNPSNATIDRATLDPDAPASARAQFSGATSAATLPFTTFTFTELVNEAYSTPALLSILQPIALPGNVTATATATSSSSSPAQTSVIPFTGAAVLAQPCITAMAAMAGGILIAVV